MDLVAESSIRTFVSITGVALLLGRRPAEKQKPTSARVLVVVVACPHETMIDLS